MRKWSVEELKVPAARPCDEIKLTCKIITPVFGGGVDPKRPDPVTPVRGAAIRGHLRFWWRASSDLSSVEELRKREVELFGGVHGDGPVASRVSVAVTSQPRPAPMDVFVDGDDFRTVDDDRPGLAYGAFPLRSKDKKHDKLWRYGGNFELFIRFSAGARDDLERALWAWLHFGGIGGRTRRGFGAVEMARAEGFKLRDLEEGWPSIASPSPIWPTLSTFALSRPRATSEDAWDHGLRLLRDMRQGKKLGRNSPGRKPNTPGRSRWPEPDAIRALYQGRVHGPHTNRLLDFDKYPRGAFGAPIIFHFKEESGEAEPPDTTLVPVREGKPLSRLASPLIIRPHRGAGDRYHALGVKLAQPSTGWALLEGNDTVKAQSLVTTLTREQADRIEALRDLSADPVDAYLARLCQR